MFKRFFGSFSRDVAIDLGTSNTRVYVKDRGLVIDSPSVVAVNKRTGQIAAVGEDAKQMLGKTPPHIVVTRPMSGGVISDYEVTQKMLKYFFDKVHEDGFTLLARPNVIISVPLQVTEVETKAVEDVTIAAGASDVTVVQSLMSAAIGSHMPVQDPVGNMVIDLGAGKTESAIISLDGVVTWKSTSVGGDEMSRSIIQYAREVFNLLVGETHAEQIKNRVGSAIELSEKLEFPMRGRDVVTGLPKEVMITDVHIREALERSVRSITTLVKTTIEQTPPELVADIHERGILLTGGGALLRGLDQVLAKATDIPVNVADETRTSVIRGSGFLLEDPHLLQAIKLPSARGSKR